MSLIVRCPYCREKMKEVSREEFGTIDIVYHCPKCGREPMATYEFSQFSDEDDNYLEGDP